MTLPKQEQDAIEQIGTKNFYFKAFAELSWELCNNRDDNIVFINGRRGVGKSMAGLGLLKYYLENYLNIDFTKQVMRDHIVYEHELLFERAKNLPLKHPVLVDEGVRVAYTGDFGTKEVKDLIKFFAQCRTKNRLVIFVSPDFFDIAKRLRQYARYRIRMIQRGQGILFARDNSEGTDPFHLDILKDLERYHDDLTPVENILNKLQKHPCYKDKITFPDIPQQVQEWYDEYRDFNVYKSTGHSGTPEGNEKLGVVAWNLKDKFALIKKALPSQFKAGGNQFLYDTLCFNPLNNEPLLSYKNWCDQIKKMNDKIEKAKDLAEKIKAGGIGVVQQSGQTLALPNLLRESPIVAGNNNVEQDQTVTDNNAEVAEVKSDRENNNDEITDNSTLDI